MKGQWKRIHSRANVHDYSALRSRERRRRRMAMRNLASTTRAAQPPPSNEVHVESSSQVVKNEPILTSVVGGITPSVLPGNDVEVQVVERQNPPLVAYPSFGSISIAGMVSQMEDTVAVHRSLCRPALTQRRPVHFFAAFDGHGGRHVAALCKERMHVFLQEQLMRLESDGDGSSSSSAAWKYLLQNCREGDNVWKAAWRSVLKRSFLEMNDVAVNTCACGNAGFNCGCCHPMALALGGSTAAVVLLTPQYIITANCGDSRAVLCRGGVAIPLSSDHKPDRVDEHARINASGGRVIFADTARVDGILAMSRAIGDKFFKPYVTAEPEITFIKRDAEDECIILATDGLWDVVSNQLACNVALECLGEADLPILASYHRLQIEAGKVPFYPPQTTLAAMLLTRLAISRRSRDNISVIVVNLKGDN